MQNDELRKAIDLIKNNQKNDGEKILSSILGINPNNEMAWLWLASCKNKDIEKVYCLEQALRINPQNEKVRQIVNTLNDRIKKAVIPEPEIKEIVESRQDRVLEITKPVPVSDNSTFTLPNVPIVQSRRVEFIAAVCPNCGGELRVPENLRVAKCIYCAYDVIIQNPNQYNVEVNINRNIPRLLELARKFEAAQNFTESYNYYSQILEYEQENRSAWLGKARGASQQSNLQNSSLEESMSYINTAIQLDSKIDDDVKSSIVFLISGADKYAAEIVEYFEGEYDRKKPANIPDPVMQIGKMVQEKKIVDNLNAKLDKHYKVFMKTINYSWKINPSENVAKWVYHAIGHIYENPTIPSEIKSWVEDVLQPVITEIKKAYPHLQYPRKKACFIATATLGDPSHPYIITLRKYRDDVLSSTQIGQIFVRRYYQYSPKFAQMIESSRLLRIISLVLIVKPAYLLAKGALSNRL